VSRDLFVREMRHIGVDVSRETRDQLEGLVNTLVRWQKAINLVGNATMDSIWVRHVLDSAQLKLLIPQSAKTLTDLGSGAGFPGLVAAAMRPAAWGWKNSPKSWSVASRRCRRPKPMS
jgi:16S rRNA (guanine527-N7)-methyltransferase